RQGGIHAFHELLRTYEAPVMRLALRVTGSEQHSLYIYREVFLLLYRNLDSIPCDVSVDVSIYRAAARLFLGYLHQEQPRQRTRIPAAPLDRALSALTPRERIVIELKHYQGLRLAVIGEALHTTEDVARNILVRATSKLRELQPSSGIKAPIEVK